MTEKDLREADRIAFARETARRGWKPEGRFSPAELEAYEGVLGDLFREKVERILDALDGKLVGTKLDLPSGAKPSFFQILPCVDVVVKSLSDMISQAKGSD